MKKKIIASAIAAVVILLAIFLIWRFFFSGDSAAPGEDSPATVSSVAGITGIGSGIGLETRFSGVVEAQKTIDIRKDADKKVSKLYVAQGDSVRAGDKLFKYDTDDISLKLEQSRLEVETIANKIQTLYNQIADLKKERSAASDDEYLSYTLQIQSLELDVKTEEYNKTTKANEVTATEKSLSNTTVKSEIDGIVKSINSTGESMNGQEAPYISILGTGNYRVKCVVSELAINTLSQGQSVIIRSRIDNEQTWTGVIETIDRESQADNDNQGGMVQMGGQGGNQETASKYNAYVELDNYDGLILGQHVYAELDFGQGEKKEGLWLPSFYIVSDSGKSYVWARGKNEKLEKRQVTLGEQDPEMDTYQITDGLQVTDFIAFPEENLKSGMSTAVGDYTGGMQGGTEMIPEGEGGTEMMPEGEGGTEMMPEGEGGTEMMPKGEGGAETIPEGEGGAEIIPEGEGTVPKEDRPAEPAAKDAMVGTVA